MSTGPILFWGSAEETNTRIHTNTHFGLHFRCVNHTDHAFEYKKITALPFVNINALQNRKKKKKKKKKQSLCLRLYPTPNELENKNNSPNKSNPNSKHSSRPSHTNFGEYSNNLLVIIGTRKMRACTCKTTTTVYYIFSYIQLIYSPQFVS